MKKRPEIVLRDGKPSLVILDIDEYELLLERAEDLKDLKLLRTMRKRKLQFRRLEDFLKEYQRSV
jgi:PHD/YefM family antitoxin component YafN of YafNO toxin-antitoxin module